MCRQRQFASTQTQKSQNLSQVLLLLLPSTLKDHLIMPGLWNYRENVKYFRPAFNPSIFTHIRGVRARKFVAFGSLHQEPKKREMPLKRDTYLSAQWRKRCNCVCCSSTANRSTDIPNLCQIPSPDWTTLWLFHLQELVWQCLTEKRHQTQNKILQCFPSHPILCGTVFWSIFLQRNCLFTTLSPSLLILTASHVPTHTLHQKSS